MADTQGLFDALAGAGGSQINRPQLNQFVAQSQARNGLMSAQTQDALIKAQQGQEKADAYSRIPDELMSAFPDMKPSEAQLSRDYMIQEANGDPVAALKAIGTLKLGYGSPQQQTSGQQMTQGKVAPLENVPNNYAVPAGQAPPTVLQSPQGAAQTADTQSQTALRNAQASAGGFNPHTGQQGGPIDPNMVNFGGYMLYHTGKMPAMGMGGGPARAAIIANAAQLAQQEQAQPGSTVNPAFDTAIQNGQDFTASGRALGSFAGGSLGNTVRSTNNGVGHLMLMKNLFNALQNGDVQTANKVGNLWTKQFGSPAPTNVQAAAEVLGPEMMKILANNSGAGTKEEREAFSSTVGNLGNAPEQTSQAIDTLLGMFGRQAADLALQYHGATQRNDFASRYLQPDVMRALNLDPGAQQVGGAGSTPAPGGAPTAPAAPTRIQNDDDFNKLPSGALFIGPDGHTRRKP